MGGALAGPGAGAWPDSGVDATDRGAADSSAAGSAIGIGGTTGGSGSANGGGGGSSTLAAMPDVTKARPAADGLGWEAEGGGRGFVSARIAACWNG